MGDSYSASVAFLEWPGQYLMVKLNNASSLNSQICEAPCLLSSM